ncbi:ubiquitin-specific protease usp4 [Cystoisospora suis]|uniref:Ubiquitin-specific protease usp4 n=1 Tax=Cystoisospora suis TaxID=483139 RepID=A0A2C6L6W0_9APIC|nr:ubiquitin-specific protease usp4 [Cystoisospora suis]
MDWNIPATRTPCVRKDQAAVIWGKFSQPMCVESADETWYVVDREFLDNLRSLATEGVVDDGESIGLSQEDLPLKIRNKPLLDKECRNKPRATKVSRLDDSVAFAQGDRYELVNEPFWRLLMNHFECDIEIPRRVYRDGRRLRVEVQPLSLAVYTVTEEESQTAEGDTQFVLVDEIPLSLGDTVDEVQKKVLLLARSDDLCVLRGYFDARRRRPTKLQPLNGPGLSGSSTLAEAAVDSSCLLVAVPPAVAESLTTGNGNSSFGGDNSTDRLNNDDLRSDGGGYSTPASGERSMHKRAGLLWDAQSVGQRARRSSPESSLQLERGNSEDRGDAGHRLLPAVIGPQMPALGRGAGGGEDSDEDPCEGGRERQCDGEDSIPQWSDENRGGTGAANVDQMFATGGLCGLVNLGNTCFMNSAVQCLSKVLPLSSFFLSGRFVRDINEENVMGTQGRLARAFHATLRDMWFGRDSPLAPRDLKWAIGRVREEFHGYNQQDSQELMAFLLDGLHEDLNRIKKKPYYESKIEGGPEKSDAEVAELSWRRHREINDSIIVDLFQGQYRSRLQCPECGRVSVTFDPFMYLSLPVPPEWKHQLMFTVGLDPRRPQGFRFERACAGNLDYDKAKEICLDVVHRLLSDEVSEELGGADAKQMMQRQILASTQLKDVSQLSAANIIMFAKRPEDLAGVYQQDVNVKVFAAEDVVKYRFDRKPSHVYAWLMPARVVEELEGCVRKDSRRDVNTESSMEVDFDETTTARGGDSDVAATAAADVPSSASTANAVHPRKTLDGHEAQGEAGCGGSEDSWKVLSEYMSDDPEAPSETESHRVKKRKSNSFSLGSRSLAETGTFFAFVLPVVKTPSGDVRPLSGCMPLLLPVLGSSTCEDLAKQVETAYLYGHEEEQSPTSSEPDQTPSVDDGEGSQRSLINHAVGFIKSFSGQGNLAGTRPINIIVAAGFSCREPQKSVLSQGVNLLTNGIGGRSCGQPRPLVDDDQLVSATVKPRAGDFVALLYADMESSSEQEKVALPEGIRPMGTLEFQPDTDISDCLRMFSEQERLDVDNMWYCGNCKEHVQAFKKLDLWKIPRVLILHLKRFHNISRFTRSKIGTKVTFPYKTGDYLDMTPYILPDSLELMHAKDPSFAPHYELVAVNVHSGELGGGHYFAYAKLRGLWYNFNDAWVKPVSEDSCHSSDAYMLFYRLKQDDEGWTGHDLLRHGGASIAASGRVTPHPVSSVEMTNHLVC